jgi:flagellin FlaB
MRKLLKNERGIVGIEAAIVLIAFLIVAAALSYVIINMGFYITQKTKETMQSSLDESLGALQLDGLVSGKTNNNSHIEWLIIPVKLSVGREGLDLKKNTIVISVYLSNATLLNI